jgi:hypothetical protein
MKNFAFSLLLITNCFGLASGQATNTYDSNLKILLANHITEKSYLHFDKPYYAAGDTIYFKAYVTLGDQFKLSNLSHILRVDFIGVNSEIIRSIKLNLMDGVAWGDFAIADSVPKGNYRVRAYTNWMRNMGDDNLLEQVIPIGSLNSITGTTKLTLRKQPAIDVQFFPEGGELLQNVNCKVAFKAIDNNGKGVNINGIVADNNGKQITQFKSGHLGMGYFYLKPELGRMYTAKITAENGRTKDANLPLSNQKGLILSVNNDSLNKIAIKVVANALYFNENKDKQLIIEIISAGLKTTVKTKLIEPALYFDVQKKKLHTGVTRITLMAEHGDPVSERLVFVQSPDLLSIKLNSDKKEYAKRDKVNISVDAATQAGLPAAGNFSVSVIDENKVTVDENTESTILTNMLLTNELKGYIEQPGYYFANESQERIKDLDVLLLTQGYRRFIWKPGTDSSIAYPPEKSLQISGVAKTGSGKHLSNGEITLVNRNGGPLLKQNTTNTGEFNFANLNFTDTALFILKATNQKGGSNNKIIFKKNAFTPPTIAWHTFASPDTNVNDLMHPYLANKRKILNNLEKISLSKTIQLKQVDIRASKTKPPYRTLSYAGAGNANQVLHMNDIKGGGTLSAILNGRLRGITFIDGVPSLSSGLALKRSMLIVVDGNSSTSIENTPGGIDIFSFSDIETIEILSGPNAPIYGMGAGGGVMVITTRQGGREYYPDTTMAQGITSIKVAGFYKAREFYAPAYDVPVNNNPGVDLRTTIYWNPNLITDKNGQTSFSFFNADGTGNYRVVVEGIDATGKIGRQVYRYTVK